MQPFKKYTKKDPLRSAVHLSLSLSLSLCPHAAAAGDAGKKRAVDMKFMTVSGVKLFFIAARWPHFV